ncbi:MAG: hypothetical protein LIV24_08715, partial [Eubacterium sp.]|nr:hypothetical protein [Eubacterium sp.]
MSKALKTIVGIILALFIASGAALIIPTFAGVDMRVVQPTTTGNIAVGSAVYSKELDSSSIAEGQKILGIGTNSLNIYTVKSYSKSDGTIVANDGTQDQDFQVSSKYLKVICTIPFIGYLMIATQSKGGMLCLGLILALVVFLFIAAEVIRRGDEDEDEEDYEDAEEDDAFYQTLAARKKKRDAQADVAAEMNRNAAHRAAAQAGRQTGTDAGTGRTGSAQVNQRNTSADTNGMTEITGSEPSASSAAAHAAPDEKEFGTDSLPDVQAALEAALESQPLNHTGETARIDIPQQETAADADAQNTASSAGEIELAMPVHTAD